MAGYAAQWDNVWVPYRNYAARNNDQGAITIIAHVNDIKEEAYAFASGTVNIL
jgi:hypothetical protein